MNHGYWDNGVILLTECFTKIEVYCLIEQLDIKFGLIRGSKKRYQRTEIKGNVRLCYSSKAENIHKLIYRVKPYMHLNMISKFGQYRKEFVKE